MVEKINNGPESRRHLNVPGVLRISGSTLMKIGTWNVRSMYQAGKTHDVIREMRRLKISVMGISEMRWPSSGKCRVDGYDVFYSGGDDNHHKNGVGFIVNKEVARCINNFSPISDRVALLQINTKPFILNLIQVYAPIADALDDDVEQLYADIDKAKNYCGNSDITIVMGDFNAKVGCGKREEVVGDFGLGTSNERGDRFVQFCQEQDLIIMNTFFKLHPRRLYTWISNANRNVKNQIDYITVNRRFRNIIKSTKTYPGADVFSDHNLLVATVKLKMKRCVKKRHMPHIDVRRLDDPEIKALVQNEIQTKLNNVNERQQNEDIESTWCNIKEAINSVTRDRLKSSGPVKLKPWMTNEILQQMDLRRTYKNVDTSKYLEIQRSIRRQIRKAKEQWLTNECREIEQLSSKHDSFNMHKKVKQAAGICRSKCISSLADENGKLLNTEEKLKEWKLYVERLFNDDRANKPEINVDNIISITRREVENAIKQSKNGRAAGPDGIQAEILKLLIEDDALSKLVDLLNTVYRTGIIPSDWLKSTFVALPKKPKAKACSEHRMISLMSHVLKLFLKIIHARIYTKCEERMGNTQFGFRNGFGTREALFSMQVLTQRCRDMNVDVFACFIDYEKAFDMVQHDRLIKILSQLDLGNAIFL